MHVQFARNPETESRTEPAHNELSHGSRRKHDDPPAVLFRFPVNRMYRQQHTQTHVVFRAQSSAHTHTHTRMCSLLSSVCMCVAHVCSHPPHTSRCTKEDLRSFVHPENCTRPHGYCTCVMVAVVVMVVVVLASTVVLLGIALRLCDAGFCAYYV